MTRRDGIDRRKVLRLLATVAGSGWLGSCGDEPSDEPAADPPTFHAIGLAYLKAHPEEGDPQRIQELLGQLQIEALRPLSRRDYEQRRTFRADGWVLSQTEGRLCALALLLS